MASAHNDSRCGYCLNEGKGRTDPRRLTCGHEFCLGCLQAAKRDCQRSGARLKCMHCSTATQLEILTALPAAVSHPIGVKLNCDTCIRKDVQCEASFYCTDCKKKYCTSHHESHDELNGWDHTVLSIEEYQQQSAKLEIRYCPEHPSCPLTMGCKLCKNICCHICTANSQHGKPCTGCRSGHQYDTLQALEKLSLDSIKNTIRELLAKREKLAVQQSQTLAVDAKVDPHVAALTEQLQAHMQKQIEFVMEEYSKQKNIVDQAASTHHNKLQAELQEIQKSLDEVNEAVMKYKTTVPNLHSVDIVAEEQIAQTILSRVKIPQKTAPLQLQLTPRELRIKQLQVVTGNVNQPQPAGIVARANQSPFRAASAKQRQRQSYYDYGSYD